MLIAGIILFIAGTISFFYGNSLNNSIESQLSSLLSSGSTNPGTIFVVIGSIVAVAGAVLIIISLVQRYKK